MFDLAGDHFDDDKTTGQLGQDAALAAVAQPADARDSALTSFPVVSAVELAILRSLFA